MVRHVNDAARARRRLRHGDVFLDALDLPENRVKRMLQRAVDRIALGRAELVEVRVDPLARLQLALPVTAAQVTRDVLPGENRLGNVVGEHRPALYQTGLPGAGLKACA